MKRHSFLSCCFFVICVATVSCKKNLGTLDISTLQPLLRSMTADRSEPSAQTLIYHANPKPLQYNVYMHFKTTGKLSQEKVPEKMPEGLEGLMSREEYVELIKSAPETIPEENEGLLIATWVQSSPKNYRIEIEDVFGADVFPAHSFKEGRINQTREGGFIFGPNFFVNQNKPGLITARIMDNALNFSSTPQLEMITRTYWLLFPALPGKSVAPGDIWKDNFENDPLIQSPRTLKFAGTYLVENKKVVLIRSSFESDYIYGGGISGVSSGVKFKSNGLHVYDLQQQRWLAGIVDTYSESLDKKNHTEVPADLSFGWVIRAVPPTKLLSFLQ